MLAPACAQRILIVARNERGIDDAHNVEHCEVI